MTNAIKNIARGYLFLHLNINLGTLNILPNWVGYLLIYRTLAPIGEEEPSARLLKPLAILLGVWEGIQWILALTNIRQELYISELIAGAIGLYFHFQLLTNLAAIAKQHGCPEHTKLLTLRTVRTLLITLLQLPLPWQQYEAAGIMIVLIQAIVALWITVVLYAFRRSLIEKTDLD